MKTAKIQEKIYNGTQSLNFTGIYKLTSKDGQIQKIQVTIKRDSYDFQSYARVSAWDGTKGWNFITSLDFDNTRTFDLFNQKKAADLTPREKAAFQADTQQLIDLAAEIIF